LALPVPQMQSEGKRTSLAGRVATAWGVITGADQAWFGPGEPLTPVAPPETAGRTFDYDFAFNNNTRKRAGTAITFDQLRALADGYDLLRVVLETRKDQLAKCDWQILPKDDKTPPGPTAQKATEFWRSPDKRNGWDEWLRMLLEEMYVIDALAIVPQKTVGGEVHAFELIDGSTINRLIDANGRTPIEGPAYQQILKGVVAGNFTVDELIYRCRNPRVSRLYGYSVVEQIIITVNIALRRQANQLSYYTEGSLPSMVFGVPDTWSPDQIKQMQGWWDDLTIKGRNYQARFIPGGVKPFDLKEQALKDEFDEWLARLVCFAFSIEPTPFVKMTNRATAETARQQSLEEGVAPVQRWVKARIDECLAIQGWGDHQFIWAEEESIDPLVQAQIAQIYVSSKIITADEARDDLGMEPLSDEQKADMAPEAFSPGAAADGVGPATDGANGAPPVAQPAAKLEAITLKKKTFPRPKGNSLRY
jgi:hypothetical protein